MMHSVQMLLRALQHPQADSVQEDALRNLVPWLEDRKIRAYKLADRPALTSTESSDWQGVYDTVRTRLQGVLPAILASAMLRAATTVSAARCCSICSMWDVQQRRETRTPNRSCCGCCVWRSPESTRMTVSSAIACIMTAVSQALQWCQDVHHGMSQVSNVCYARRGRVGQCNASHCATARKGNDVVTAEASHRG